MVMSIADGFSLLYMTPKFFTRFQKFDLALPSLRVCRAMIAKIFEFFDCSVRPVCLYISPPMFCEFGLPWAVSVDCPLIRNL